MNEEFTPGPWEASDRGDYGDYDGNCQVIIGDDMRVAVVQNGGDPWAYANAHLIAKAPELYHALLISGQIVKAYAQAFPSEAVSALIKNNDALLAAARGETQ
jgi:hypothetical protein